MRKSLPDCKKKANHQLKEEERELQAGIEIHKPPHVNT
jgi:hypothetical protein